MKTITIIGADKVESTSTLHRVGKDLVVYGNDEMSICDGYHTMDELYDHRITLYIALCEVISAGGFYKNPEVWRSKVHSDGSVMEGWFIMGINETVGQQITYHIPIEKWEDCEFAKVLEKAPEWDGHTSSDVLKRLATL